MIQKDKQKKNALGSQVILAWRNLNLMIYHYGMLNDDITFW